jgi:hypothetical protein
MKPRQLWWVLGALLAASGCATAPSTPNPIMFGRTQPLTVRTDPPGATCTLAQRGEIVGTVEVTPGVAQVPRDFKSSFFEDIRTAEGKPPLEIACRKDGYLGFRRQFQAQFVGKVWQEELALQARPEPTPAETAKDAAAAVAGAAGAVVVVAAPTALGGPLGMALVASGGAVLAPVAAIAIVGIIAIQDQPRREYFAYRPLPEFHLVPAQFESATARDAFFADLEAKLRSAHAQTRARIDANCWFQPCKPSDAQPCQDPWCQRLREVADVDLQTELDRIPETRAQVRIGAAPE